MNSKMPKASRSALVTSSTQSRPPTLTNLPQKITLIDCDQVCETTLLDANHQYYRKRPEVLADICAVLDGTRPEAMPGRVWVPARGAFVVAAKP
jgi:esterase/lipase superfamily enzyme